MHQIRTSVLAMIVATSGLTSAQAKDFFVQAILPGPVAAPALPAVAAIGGSSTTGTSSGTTTTPTTTTSTTTTSTKTVTETAGKWLKAPTTTTTASATTTTSLTSGSTTGSVTVSGTPWKSMSALFASGQVAGGDRIFLMDGYHGGVRIDDKIFTAPVTIQPLPGSTAHLDTLLINNSANLHFRDLKVWATNPAAPIGAVIRSYPSARNLTFQNLDVRSVAGSSGYAAWTATDWTNNKRNGFLLDGNNVSVINTRVTGVYHGLVAMADNTLLQGNVIDGFSGDGMRAIGDNSVVRGNRIQNCISVSANHADGFQSYSVGPTGKPGTGTLYNLVIENNEIFESVGQRLPLTCRLQGIGMFDGMYDGVRVENNTIIASAYHGLTIAGALNSIVRHNTVIASNGLGGKSPWIRVNNHKNGTPSKNVDISNNLATNFTSTANPTNNITMTGNVRAGAAANEFVDFNKRDLSLKATSPATDKGDVAKIVNFDIEGTKRWMGKGPDAGAYESN